MAKTSKLIDWRILGASYQCVARLTLEPDFLANRIGNDFQQGFDGLDYLEFAAYSFGANGAYFVRHHNAPESGTLIYLNCHPKDQSLMLSKTLQRIRLNRDSIDWLHPNVNVIL